MGETREEVTSEDMISDLPEDLLVSILMRVPTKDAVATMILSKRWRFIWTMMLILDYKESDDESKKKSVWWLLDKSMQLHKAPVLAFLLIKLGPQCPLNADVGKWIAKAVDRGLVVLELDLLCSVVDPISLPKTLYLCESLKELTLSNQILVDVVPTTTARLPSLRILDLDNVVYKNEDSLINLLASCPVLEYLLVTRKKDDNVRKFTVKSPCLLDLLYESICDVYEEEEEDTGRCLVIDAPALTEFNFFDLLGETSIETQQSCFEQVSILSLVGWSFPDTDKFLRSVSTVLSLVLHLSEEMVMCCRTIKFPRLIDCTIYPCDTDWMDSFVSFLQNTPKLKFLTIYTDSPPIASMSKSESSYEPVCLSSSLEKFELAGYGGREEEEELVEYILTNAKCLKTATISMRSTLTLADKDTMMEKLRAIPRVSKTSELKFKTDELNL